MSLVIYKLESYLLYERKAETAFFNLFHRVVLVPSLLPIDPDSSNKNIY